MIYAEINGRRVEPLPNTKAICPQCKGSVVSKCGAIKTWHWAHESTKDCDSWSEGETDWHKEWKNLISIDDPDIAEVTIRNGISMHRADICLRNKKVIEFQHSPISVDEIQEREWFYGSMVWVFDATEAFRKKRIYPGKKEGSFRWKQPKKTIQFCNKPVYLDLGENWHGDERMLRIHWLGDYGGKGEFIDRNDFLKNECA